MAKHGKKLTDNLAAEDLSGVKIGFLAEENEFDRRTLWRLASWGVGAVCAVTLGVLANQSYSHLGRDRSASIDLARQSEQIQSVAKETRNELKRLSAAVDTLNADRDRLYARTTSLEQGLESMTGSIARQTAALTPPLPAAADAHEQKPLQENAAKAPEPAPTAQPVLSQPVPVPAANSTVPAITPQASSSTVATTSADSGTPIAATEADTAASTPTPPTLQLQSESAHSSSLEIAALPMNAPALAATEKAAVEVVVPRTAFGVDLGTANSIDGLRAVWRRISASHRELLSDLRPVVALRERKGTPATQLRLIAGPLDDAAAAAKICVTIAAGHHACETAVFDGQRLAVNVEPAPAAHPPHRRTAPRRIHHESTAARPAQPLAPPPATSTR